MKRVLITGINGFVGSALAIRLLKAGVGVVGLVKDRNYKSRRDILDQVSVVYGDLEDTDIVRYAVTKYEVDTIFHLGAVTILRIATIDPLTCYRSNVIGTVNVLEAARNARHVKKVIVASCYDESTRIVTPDGLKTFDTVKVGDIVFSVNPDTKRMEEATVEEVVIQDYIGPMISFKGKKVDLLVTPNHKMALFDRNGDMQFLSADSPITHWNWTLPSGKWSGSPLAAIPDHPKKHWNANALKPGFNLGDLFYLLGIYIGDGCIQHQEPVRESKTGLTAREYVTHGKDKTTGRFIKTGIIGQRKTSSSRSNVMFLYIPRKDDCRVRVESALERIGIKACDWNHGGEGALVFSSPELCHWFKDAGVNVHDKHIPMWALQFGPEYLERLLAGILDSDGSRGRMITTVSERLVCGVIEIGHKLGIGVSFRWIKPPKKSPIIRGREIKASGAFNIYLQHRTKSILPKHKSVVPYNGKVWCLRLSKNKNFLVERNGRVDFCGNSDKAYGVHKELPYTEAMCLLASDSYSTSKSCTDLIAQSYHYTYGLDVSLIRSGNIYGPGDLNCSRLIPGCIIRVLRGERPVIYRGVGSYKREFMFIDDAVDAYLKVAELGLAGHAYNVGGSGFQTIIRTVEMIIKAIGSSIEPEIVEKEFIEIKEQYLDSAKLQALGWSCKYPIKEGIEATIPWYKTFIENPSLLFYAN